MCLPFPYVPEKMPARIHEPRTLRIEVVDLAAVRIVRPFRASIANVASRTQPVGTVRRFTARKYAALMRREAGDVCGGDNHSASAVLSKPPSDRAKVQTLKLKPSAAVLLACGVLRRFPSRPPTAFTLTVGPQAAGCGPVPPLPACASTVGTVSVVTSRHQSGRVAGSGRGGGGQRRRTRRCTRADARSMVT